jgi:hypothetical protein
VRELVHEPHVLGQVPRNLAHELEEVVAVELALQPERDVFEAGRVLAERFERLDRARLELLGEPWICDTCQWRVTGVSGE